jgi:hypothetical protein
MVLPSSLSLTFPRFRARFRCHRDLSAIPNIFPEFNTFEEFVPVHLHDGMSTTGIDTPGPCMEQLL